MKTARKWMMLVAFLSITFFGSIVYASDSSMTESNIELQTITKDDKQVEVITTKDQYVRITQPTKVNTSTFESKLNIMGETTQGTEILIKVYNTKEGTRPSSKDVATYELKPVGITGNFSQLIELLEGENKIVLTYSNEKDNKDKEEMIFYLIRESEEKKELIKTMTVVGGTINLLK